MTDRNAPKYAIQINTFFDIPMSYNDKLSGCKHHQTQNNHRKHPTQLNQNRHAFAVRLKRLVSWLR